MKKDIVYRVDSRPSGFGAMSLAATKIDCLILICLVSGVGGPPRSTATRMKPNCTPRAAMRHNLYTLGGTEVPNSFQCLDVVPCLNSIPTPLS